MVNTETNNALNDLATLVRMVVSDPKRIQGMVDALEAASSDYADKLGAIDTLEKARLQLTVASDKSAAASKILDGAQAKADGIVLEAEAQASLLKRDAENDREAARRLRAEEQALKDKAQRELDAKEKELTLMKQDLDGRQSELNRREINITEQEKALADKKRRIDQALAG